MADEISRLGTQRINRVKLAYLYPVFKEPIKKRKKQTKRKKLKKLNDEVSNSQ